MTIIRIGIEVVALLSCILGIVIGRLWAIYLPEEREFISLKQLKEIAKEKQCKR